jgi:hypothetical protein
MDSYKLEQSPKTPFIHFNSNGTLEMKGKSIPENTPVFFKPMFEWLDKYIQTPSAQTVLNIQLDYFNTSSSKVIVDLFKKLEQIPKSGKGEAIINWLYSQDDVDMLEAGEDYQSIVKIPFNLVSYKRN